jgi:hypothetical protein
VRLTLLVRRIPVWIWFYVALLRAASGDSNVNPVQAYAWGENVGWLTWRPDPLNGVEVSQFICAGYIYSGNLGWINLGSGLPDDGIAYQNNSASDFGVNVDQSGNLEGLAYGGNIGWIVFEKTGAPRVDLGTGKLSGFAYGANVGWIDLGDAASGVKVDSISAGTDSDGDGIPDAWEMRYAGNLTTFTATSDYDGDGQSDLQEYLADTNPLDPTDYLHIVAFSLSEDKTSSAIAWNTKPTRQYRILIRPSLAPSGSWFDSGLGLQSPNPGVMTRTVYLDVTDTFFRIEAVRPLAPQ